DKTLHNMRPDLVLAGRTLFGAHPPKGQQLEDHYFGSIRARVLSYMMEVEDELVKLGIPVKTRHNEVAPNQFEIAPIFEEVSVAADHNQVTMEVLRKVAIKHSLALLLHEKPFSGINGSGKHNNFSMCDDFGNNLLEPGHTPFDNLQFLVILLATIRAVKTRGHLLRASVASAGNDHRLGANEAPPAIMSVFIGEQLMEVIDRIENETAIGKSKSTTLDLGLDQLPIIRKDATDRNRTSPFAFTGNKFEFRAVGSSASIAWPNCVLNTIVAESLDVLCDRIEAKMRTGDDFKKAVLSVARETITEVRPVIFNGDNYSKEWEKEAEKRGLINDRDTPSALKHWVAKETVDLFSKYKVFKETELKSRYHIHLESYIKTVNIEAMLSKEMAQTIIFPAAVHYIHTLSKTAKDLSQVAGLDDEAKKFGHELLNELVALSAGLNKEMKNLDKAVKKAMEESDFQKEAEEYRHKVIPVMNKLRETGDRIEQLVDDSLWSLPKYREMLFLM
ncbi:MAG: glutamine synthetase, partial [Elusimicrobia bacterium RIFOXYB2_FULL_49_7]